MGGSFGAGLVVSPLLLFSGLSCPASRRLAPSGSAIRVDGFDSGVMLNGRLRDGWEIEQQDSDGRGTTYFLRRDKNLPFPAPSPSSTPDPTWRIAYEAKRLAGETRSLGETTR